MTTGPITAWDCDTLCGRLVAWTLPEDREGDDPPYRKFGYWRMVEKRMIRAELIAAGLDPDDNFAIARRIEANHRNDPSLAERQAMARAAQPPRTPALAFTRDELEHLASLFQDANDPTSRAIGAKARMMLNAL